MQGFGVIVGRRRPDRPRRLGTVASAFAAIAATTVPAAHGAADAVATLPTAALTAEEPAETASPGPDFDDASPPPGYRSTNLLFGSADAGEPSLGVDWRTGAAMYKAWTQISRVTFDDSVSPARARWTDVTPKRERVNTGADSMLFTDHATGRTFYDQLMFPLSTGDVSDDDGATWRPVPLPPLPHGTDHQSIASGPYAARRPPAAGVSGHPHAVYYCSQSEVDPVGAFCGRSDTGGMTYNPAVPVFGAASPCRASHGHLKVAPDGTVYLPQYACRHPDGSPGQGMAVSTDNGSSWTYPVVPDSVAVSDQGGWDPSVGVGRGGTVYFAHVAGDGHPMVAVSHDRGASWTPSVDIAPEAAIRNTEFPAAVAGDDDRAAVTFVATTAPGDPSSDAFRGVWYLYVAVTYDAGRTWTTVDVTPGDPVQRGCLAPGGTSGSRCLNLFDFNDIDIDAHGRILVAYTDGCVDDDTSRCRSDPAAYAPTDKAHVDGLARQRSGRGFLRAFDEHPRP
jgi:hypothetical protein